MGPWMQLFTAALLVVVAAVELGEGDFVFAVIWAALAVVAALLVDRLSRLGENAGS